MVLFSKRAHPEELASDLSQSPEPWHEATRHLL